MTELTLNTNDNIELKPGLTWRTIPQVQIMHMLDQRVCAERLSAIASDWREATGKFDLHGVKVECDIGTLLDDFARIIELTN
jgi:lipid II:glycine glycyltransferase (peptidoglycan interpeptide bridge formation enzyme)